MNEEYIEENHPVIQYLLAIMVVGWGAGILVGIGDIFIDYEVKRLYEIIIIYPLILVALVTMSGTPQVKTPRTEYLERQDNTTKLLIFGTIFWSLVLIVLFIG